MKTLNYRKMQERETTPRIQRSRTLKIRFKKLTETATIPTRAHDTDAGFDLTTVSQCTDLDGNMVYGTGISVEIPKGYVGLVFPRSSISKKQLSLSNSVGVIDAGYRGEIMAKFRNEVKLVTFQKLLSRIKCLLNPAKAMSEKGVFVTNNIDCNVIYHTGDRIAQLIIMRLPSVEFEEVEELSESDRGEEGYGSTGE